MSFPYITHYSSMKEIRDICLTINKKYDNEWDVPYTKIENAIKRIVDSYPQKSSGLAAMCQRGPGEFRDIITEVVKYQVVLS